MSRPKTRITEESKIKVHHHRSRDADRQVTRRSPRTSSSSKNYDMGPVGKALLRSSGHASSQGLGADRSSDQNVRDSWRGSNREVTALKCAAKSRHKSRSQCDATELPTRMSLDETRGLVVTASERSASSDSSNVVEKAAKKRRKSDDLLRYNGRIRRRTSSSTITNKGTTSSCSYKYKSPIENPPLRPTGPPTSQELEARESSDRSVGESWRGPTQVTSKRSLPNESATSSGTPRSSSSTICDCSYCTSKWAKRKREDEDEKEENSSIWIWDRLCRAITYGAETRDLRLIDDTDGSTDKNDFSEE
ncbi:hypothetical protein HPB50_021749 [Hyalomma asiaticum]|uniref:Uncharacterized protein n=1 Tax=Hyalomma asiaticum TaxID=266040 RepID=A0ACB7SYX6_HYAAI|nr:hypothetical protein HPB50_021749 [Hyalomma asiaticum]